MSQHVSCRMRDSAIAWEKTKKIYFWDTLKKEQLNITLKTLDQLLKLVWPGFFIDIKAALNLKLVSKTFEIKLKLFGKCCFIYFNYFRLKYVW